MSVFKVYGVLVNPDDLIFVSNDSDQVLDCVDKLYNDKSRPENFHFVVVEEGE